MISEVVGLFRLEQPLRWLERDETCNSLRRMARSDSKRTVDFGRQCRKFSASVLDLRIGSRSCRQGSGGMAELVWSDASALHRRGSRRLRRLGTSGTCRPRVVRRAGLARFEVQRLLLWKIRISVSAGARGHHQTVIQDIASAMERKAVPWRLATQDPASAGECERTLVSTGGSGELFEARSSERAGKRRRNKW